MGQRWATLYDAFRTWTDLSPDAFLGFFPPFGKRVRYWANRSREKNEGILSMNETEVSQWGRLVLNNIGEGKETYVRIAFVDEFVEKI